MKYFSSLTIPAVVCYQVGFFGQFVIPEKKSFSESTMTNP